MTFDTHLTVVTKKRERSKTTHNIPKRPKIHLIADKLCRLTSFPVFKKSRDKLVTRATVAYG